MLSSFVAKSAEKQGFRLAVLESFVESAAELAHGLKHVPKNVAFNCEFLYSGSKIFLGESCGDL